MDDARENTAATTAATYRRWALVESHGTSPVYTRLALAVAEDAGVLALLGRAEVARRQPNLLLGALRWHGVDVTDPPAALAWVREHPDDVLAVLRTRRTQTNEAARCALLLPALAALAERSSGPLALVEVGASAGLCLLPDAWRYRYSTRAGVHEVGPDDATVTLPCAVDGPAPLPRSVPEIAWRAGLDLHPVDPADADARRWLECLVWPEHTRRAARLGAALDVAAALRPDVRSGDMTTDLAALLDEARRSAEAAHPSDGPATVVVLHTAALVYLSPDQRDGVRAVVAAAGAHLLGAEGVSVLPDVAERLPPGTDVGGLFVVSLDGEPLALAHPHGATLTWLWRDAA